VVSSGRGWPDNAGAGTASAHRENAMKKTLAAICASLAAAAVIAGTAPDVAYPDGYRNWKHVKSMVIEAGHPLYDSFGGIHHLYANDKALDGYTAGRFPDGAVIVFDLLEAKSADHAVTEGARKLIGVMQKDRARFPATGGWGFEGFAGDSRTERLVGDAAATACFSCHQARAEQDYVFSSERG
jgi:hypothetical protein